MCMYGLFMLVFDQDLQTVFVRFAYRAAMIELTFEETQAVARSTRASPGEAKAKEAEAEVESPPVVATWSAGSKIVPPL